MADEVTKISSDRTICDAIMWRHICELKCNKTSRCNMIIDND